MKKFYFKGFKSKQFRGIIRIVKESRRSTVNDRSYHWFWENLSVTKYNNRFYKNKLNIICKVCAIGPGPIEEIDRITG